MAMPRDPAFSFWSAEDSFRGRNASFAGTVVRACSTTDARVGGEIRLILVIGEDHFNLHAFGPKIEVFDRFLGRPD
nr:hypothetical protein [Bradyrhizobium sp. CSA207]